MSSAPTLTIRPVASTDELEAAFAFLDALLALGPNHRRTIDFYRVVFQSTPELLLQAMLQVTLVGALFASVEGDHILIGEVAVAPAYQGQGIGGQLLRSIEEQTRRLGYKRLLLGAVETAERFYLAHQYRPLLFIQSPEVHARSRLHLELKNYFVFWEDPQPKLYKLIIDTESLNKSLQKRIEEILPDSATQYLFVKDLDEFAY